MSNDIEKSWSTLELKSVDSEKRIITGIASTPNTDRDGDIVDPKGAKFSLPFPSAQSTQSRYPNWPSNLRESDGRRH